MKPAKPANVPWIALALLFSLPLAAQQKKKEDERFTSYTIPSPSTLRVGEAFQARILHEGIFHYEKRSSGAYELLKGTGISEDRVRHAGRTNSSFPHGKEPLPCHAGTAAIKLIPHGSILYLKYASKYDPYENGSGITIEQNGIYEVQVVEGSFEALQAGGELTVEITKRDFERFIADQKKALEHPGLMVFVAEEFREAQLKGIESELEKNPSRFLPSGAGPADRERLLEVFRSWKVRATPFVSSTATRYHFNGNTMTSETEQVTVDIKYETFIPDPNEAVDPKGDWMERYRARKKIDFHPDDYPDPRERLPWPDRTKWVQEKPEN
jgi:hypothetical protein